MDSIHTFKSAVTWFGGCAVVVVLCCILFDVVVGKGPWRRLSLSVHDASVLLVIELALFAGVAVVTAYLSPGDFGDYFSFAAPCLAGIVVGLGVVVRAARYSPESCAESASPFMDYYFYLLSALLLGASLIVYLSTHGSMTVTVFSLDMGGWICFLAYIYAASRTKVSVFSTLGISPKVIVGAALLAVSLIATGFSVNKWSQFVDFDKSSKCPYDHGGNGKQGGCNLCDDNKLHRDG